MREHPKELDEFNKLVKHWQSGDASARDEIVKLVHKEVEHIASSILRRNINYRSIVTCELANEAFIKLFVSEDINVNSRSHFLALCARIMRFIVIDKTRQSLAQKNNADVITLTTNLAEEEDISVIALDAALTHLASVDPTRAKIVEMRYFGGMTYEEIATVTGQSVSTIKRSWRVSRVWLKEALTNET